MREIVLTMEEQEKIIMTELRKKHAIVWDEKPCYDEEGNMIIKII